jgi:acetate---CoA ligase (ADP-forming) subunit beta
MVEIMRLLEPAKAGTNRLLSEVEAKDLLKKAGIDVVKTKLAKSKSEAIALSREIGFPVVMKIVSPDIIHKSDLGGVKLNLQNSSQVGRAYSEMLSSIRLNSPQARIDGVSIQEMARAGIEVIIGMTKDPQFGPVLMFGLGGTLVEILKDVSFRLVPLERKDAAQMIRDIKGYPLLQGYRGHEAVDTAKLEESLLKVSAFVQQNPQIKELDLNPLFAYSDGVRAVDARIVLE